MKTDLTYETPEVEVIEVEVEQGFAASQGGGNPGGTAPDFPWG